MARAAPAHWLRRPLIAVGVTLAVFVWPLHAQATGGWLPVAVFAAGVLIQTAVAIEGRVLAVRRTQLAVSQEAWLPGLALSVAAAAGGFAWAPLPVARAEGEDGEPIAQPSSEPSSAAGASPGGEPGAGEPDDGAEPKRMTNEPSRPVANLHWAAPAALGALALVQLVLAAWLDVPLSRGLGAAALVMTASLLTPVKPLDGGTIACSPAGAATILAVAGTAMLVLLGVL